MIKVLYLWKLHTYRTQALMPQHNKFKNYKSEAECGLKATLDAL